MTVAKLHITIWAVVYLTAGSEPNDNNPNQNLHLHNLHLHNLHLSIYRTVVTVVPFHDPKRSLLGSSTYIKLVVDSSTNV